MSKSYVPAKRAGILYFTWLWCEDSQGLKRVLFKLHRAESEFFISIYYQLQTITTDTFVEIQLNHFGERNQLSLIQSAISHIIIFNSI
jgi:hypothetical protein